MFRVLGFLGRRPPRRLHKNRPIRFESLENRHCLAAPTILSLQIDSVDGTNVSVSGYVADENPETVQIDFLDALYGSTSPDASGYFSYSGDAISLGDIVALALDQEYLQSSPSYVELDSDVPEITSLSITYGHHTEVFISGQVLDEDPSGLLVSLAGAVTGDAITDSSGGFTFHSPDGEAYLGDVEITVADVWGQEVYDTLEIVADDPPVIVNYTASVDGSGLLVVEGSVLDEDPAGIAVEVEFNSGSPVFTDSNGHFHWQQQLEEGDEGWVTAVAYDWWDLASDSVREYVCYGFGGY